jgi:hypothetical protein
MSLFDTQLKALVDGPVKGLYGDQLTWTPSAGGSAQTATVLFRDPTQMRKLGVRTGKALYSQGVLDDVIEDPFFTYKSTELTGLYDSVVVGNVEYVTIKTQTYAVKMIEKEFDGNTLKAILESV